MFNLAIDSKLRGCDLVALRTDEICASGRVRERATILQHKTGHSVQFEITEQTRASIQDWLNARPGTEVPTYSRAASTISLILRRASTRASCMTGSSALEWTEPAYGTHSMRRTKAAQIYRKTGNLRAVQLLLGHTKLESTVRYLGLEVDDALTLSERVEF